MARRYQHLSKEICELDKQLNRLVSEVAPQLVAVEGIGTDTAASLLIAAGSEESKVGMEPHYVCDELGETFIALIH